MSAIFNARHRFALWSWAATLSLALLAHDAFGQYQNASIFSTYAYKGRSPLSVNCTLTHAASMSPGRAEVTITDLTGPSKMDRNLYVVLYTKNWGWLLMQSVFDKKQSLVKAPTQSLSKSHLQSASHKFRGTSESLKMVLISKINATQTTSITREAFSRAISSVTARIKSVRWSPSTGSKRARPIQPRQLRIKKRS